ncbi:MAG TPA: hypothetical protein VEI53_05520 [Ktedonobacteraceae bacterium]|jgi:chromosome segregation ATPase|nr:hypothetical protein [Ktedonobacteraceae bacterium]
MAKKNSTSSAVEEVDEQKKRKKQAKKEAKMMLKIEEAKVSIQKAEKKLAKSQARLEARNTHLRTLEAELTEFRSSHEETEVQTQPGDSVQETVQHVSADEDATIVPDAGFDHQNGRPELEEASSLNQ